MVKASVLNPGIKPKTAGEYLSKGNTQNRLFGCQFAICVHSLTSIEKNLNGVYTRRFCENKSTNQW